MKNGSRSDWVVVLPVKGTAAAKSRLAATSNQQLRDLDIQTVSLAFATDTIVATLACRSVADVVVVVSAESVAAFDALGIAVIRDHQRGLNAAIEQGILAARALWPGAPIAVLTADLPALTPRILGAALDESSYYPKTMVPDKDGVGTAMIAALDAASLRPRFGDDSARQHEAAGHRRLVFPADSALRLDVDTVADLARARELGLGPASRAALGY